MASSSTKPARLHSSILKPLPSGTCCCASAVNAFGYSPELPPRYGTRPSELPFSGCRDYTEGTPPAIHSSRGAASHACPDGFCYFGA